MVGGSLEPWRQRLRAASRCACILLALLIAASGASSAQSQTLPEIRLTQSNRVPACVTPERLMTFLTDRNRKLDDRFRDLARYYKQHGEANRVRWDYAFYQMILETNYLIYKTGSGRWGDVNPNQNNFAGIGTTGGGVPGDSFQDVSSGVLGQMQHLMAYSGEKVADPIGRRTRERQDDIIARSKALGRPVTFRDLTRRWAVDPRYGNSIESVAARFRAQFCTGKANDDEVASAARPATLSVAQTDVGEADAGEERPSGRRGRKGKREMRRARAARETAEARTSSPGSAIEATGAGALEGRAGIGLAGLIGPPRLAQRPTSCKVFTASYGGEKNVLIRAIVDAEMHYTALQVIEGHEQQLAQTFIREHARGGQPLEHYPNRDAALSRAFDLCPSAARAGSAN